MVVATLALSFTNESTNELQTRVEEQSGYDGGKVQVSTFHSKCNDLLKKYMKHSFVIEQLGYSEGFFIIESSDSQKLVTESVKDLPRDLKMIFDCIGLGEKKIIKELTKHRANGKNASLLAKEVLSTEKDFKLSTWKSFINLATDAEVPDDIVTVVGAKLSQFPFLKDMLISTIWKKYSELCKENHAVDFDDLILFAYFLLKHNPDIGRSFSEQFVHILIDEMQDTNNLQLLIVNLIIQYNPLCHVFVVGDPRQSIYAFRQANVDNMTKISKKLSVPFSTYELVYNYRSTQSLVEVTNCFALEMAEQETSGQLTAGNTSLFDMKSQINIFQFNDESSESEFVLNGIKEQIKNGISLDDIYVMYRSRGAVKMLEKSLALDGVPFEMVGELNLYERQETRDAMAFLRSICRKKDVMAWSRVLGVVSAGVRGTLLRSKSKEIEGLIPRDFVLSRKNNRNKIAIDNFIELYDCASEFLLSPKCEEEFARENYPNNSLLDVQRALKNQNEVIEAFNQWVKNDIIEMVNVIKEKWIETTQSSYEKIDIKKVEKNEELILTELTERRVLSISSIFDEAAKRMAEGSELSEIVADLLLRDTPTRKDRKGTIKLLTGHAAKGLEAKYVYMIGCDTSLWNLLDKVDPKADAEDERLYYVMITRAVLNLNISTVAYRVLNGKGGKSKPCKQLLEHLDYIKSAGLLNHVDVSQSLIVA